MTRIAVVVLAGLMLVLLAGCGGGGGEAGPITPPPAGGDASTVQVGPLLVRPTSAAGFVAQELPNPNGAVRLVALHGSRITYLASQALLDRIVFSRANGLDRDIWVCNLDGSNAVRLIDNAHKDDNPVWSPDGRQIAFDRTPLGQFADIVVMNADGSGPYKVTTDSAVDEKPAWSALGDQIVFQTFRTGNYEVFTSYLDGTGQINLSNNAAYDFMPACSPTVENPYIAFVSDRDGNGEIYRMGPAGQSQTRLTNTPGHDSDPAFSPDGFDLVFSETNDQGPDLWITTAGGLGNPYPFRQAPGADVAPSWSSDHRFIVYQSDVDGDYELMLRETTEPYGTFQITRNTGFDDIQPDLGSPTMQTDRVIIGPAGSDWGGSNPVWSSSDAGIAAYDPDGYRNFVRIGIRPADLPTLSISPLVTPAIDGIGLVDGGPPVGVVIEAAEIVNLREDGGRGNTPVLWLLDPLNPTAVVVYFHPMTGRVLATLVLADQNYPAAADGAGPALSQRADDGSLLVEGSLAAVFDGSGARLADAAAQVSITADTVTVLR